jgi:hypothetical protein
VLGFGGGCASGGAPRFQAGLSESSERPTGCIDTPFISPDHRSTTTGVGCGREASPAGALVRGRVVSEGPAGLPGAGREGVWVAVHVIRGPLQLDRLPAAAAEVETGPQGSFTLPRTSAGEIVVVVRAKRGGPVLAARRLEPSAESPTRESASAELVLRIPSE